MWLKESGLIDHWMSSYNHNIDKCMIKENNSIRDEIRNFTKMNMFHQIGSFLILAIGSSLSFLSFISELVFFKMTVKHQT